MPQHSTRPEKVSAEAYERARRKAASIDRSTRARIVVSGTDRAAYLQGLLTNDIVALKAGDGCYAAYLTPQGRMIADMYVYELGDLILLTAAAGVKETVIGRLEQFIFSEDVRLGDVSDTFAQLAIVGPDAARVLALVLAGAAEPRLRALGEHGNMRAQFDAAPAIVARVTDTGEPGFDVFIEREKLDALLRILATHDVAPLDSATAEALRIEAGVPLFGRDMDDDTIPLEAGIEQRAISMSKGCYVGQEVIIRVLHRGHGRVARKLVGLIIEGAHAPSPGSPIMAHAQESGRVTSSTMSPALARPIALGYVRREHAAPGTVLTIGDARATVVALPFPRHIADS
jgi:tRNA-modifying protein YgfZ